MQHPENIQYPRSGDKYLGPLKCLITNCSIMENLEDINRGLIERNDNGISFDKKLKDLSEPTDSLNIKKVTGSVKDDFVPSTALTYLAPLLREQVGEGQIPDSYCQKPVEADRTVSITLQNGNPSGT